MEIRRHAFRKGFKGYDVDEVNHFVETMAAQLEAILGEKEGLLSETRELKSRLEKYEKLEQTLQDMLLHSQKTVEEAKTHAERQATLITREAEVKAMDIKKNAEREAEELKKSIVILKEQRKMFLIKFRTLIKSQADMLLLLEAENAGTVKLSDVSPVAGDNPEKETDHNPSSAG
jgi:cell division initiation protein